MALKTFNVGEILTASDVNIYLTNSISGIRLTTKSITSSTTLQDDANLVIPLAANSSYELSGQLIYNGDPAGDLKIGWTGPAGFSIGFVASTMAIGSASYADDQLFYGTQANAPQFGCIGTGSNQTTAAMLSGLVLIAGTAGNLQLQWAQFASNATATSMLTHSFITCRRIN
jgi:hypothetical protein